MTKLHHPILFALSLCALLALPVLAVAQTAPIAQETTAYSLDSGVHQGQEGVGAATYTAFSHTVRVPGAPWLRLTFSDVELGADSYLTVTSLKDGAEQRLDAEGIAEWYKTSAYFNGDAVRLALHVAPGDEGVFVQMDQVIAGLDVVPESQCGPTDDRTSSNDPGAGRLLSVGCTGWIIHENTSAAGFDQIVSAGHCIQSGASTLQFNVPLSTGGGGLQHPGPEDQYSVNSASRVFVNGGVGNDWGVFRVFNNSQTGLQPSEAQGKRFFIRQDLSPPIIRITGYGVDGGIHNQTQQTHAGPNAGSSGTTMAYQADTQGGNSGSPVIDEATGHSVGVHTHGGCSTSGSGSNKGTSFFNSAFWNAVGAPPALCEQSLSATLDDTTPAPGQTVTFTATVTNNASSSATLDLWFEADRNGNEVRRGLLRTFTVAGNGSTVQVASVRVPGAAPSGPYDVELHIGDFSANDVCDTETFLVTVSQPRVAANPSDTEWTVVPPVAEDAVLASAMTDGVHVTPNPFRGQAQLTYTVTATSDVLLAVYDVLGREVAVLVDGRMDAGTHAATFEADGLAAGTYVYRLVAGTDVEVGRLTLAR